MMNLLLTQNNMANTGNRKGNTNKTANLDDMVLKNQTDSVGHGGSLSPDRKQEKPIKLFILDQKDKAYQEQFLRICKEKKDKSAKGAKMTKGRMRQFLALRFK
jgi:Ca2+-binding EF-hand superfamily protein